MKHYLLLAALVAGYVAVFMRVPDVRGGPDVFDPLEPRGRQVERAIETGRFADALPVAVDLRGAYPQDAQVSYWLAEIFHGLHRTREEIQAWETFVGQSSMPEEACRALAEAYRAIGDEDHARHQFERCAASESEGAE